MQQIAAAVTKVAEPEQVYTCLWSHADAVSVHIRCVVQPITRSDTKRVDALGPDLQPAMFRNGTRPEETDTGRICEQYRAIFALSR